MHMTPCVMSEICWLGFTKPLRLNASSWRVFLASRATEEWWGASAMLPRARKKIGCVSLWIWQSENFVYLSRFAYCFFFAYDFTEVYFSYAYNKQ